MPDNLEHPRTPNVAEVLARVDVLRSELERLLRIPEYDAFLALVAGSRSDLALARKLGFGLEDLVDRGLRRGSFEGRNGACANELGSIYCMGDAIGQDYGQARFFYERAADLGNVQGLVNLGYIHEYGRCGEPDHLAAYVCYSTAAALAGAPEALYKMGDCFSRGIAVPRDIRRALALWNRALEAASDIEMYAQAAARVAPALLDPEQYGVDADPDPLAALGLYQRAELGLRASIANGAVYYRKRLAEVLEGQDRARAALG